MSPPDTARECEAPHRQRVEIFGAIARACPIAGRREWIGALNADFEDGSRPWLGDLCVPADSLLLHIQTWPDPRARLRKRRDASWTEHEPYLDVAHGLIAISRQEPGRSFVDWLPHPPPAHNGDQPQPAHPPGDSWTHRAIERIPAHMRRRLAPFRFSQWNLLRLAARNPAALDLIDSNPALAWGLASPRVFFERPPVDIEAAAAERVGHRQRDIAAWLGFPATEGAVRLLKKVLPDSCGAIPLLELRALAAQPVAAEKLRHLRELSAITILAVASRILGPSLTPAALEQVVAEIARLRDAQLPEGPAPGAANIRGPTIAHLLDDTARMAQLLPGAASPRAVTSVDALRRRHDELVEQFIELSRPPQRPAPPEPPPEPARPRAPRPPRRPRQPPRPAAPFPAPPLPAGDGILPITSAELLEAEGRLQHNCVGAYAHRVRFGNYYVYSVTKPIRATLSVQKDWNGVWRIDELAAAHNRPPGEDVRRHVANWLNACNPAPPPPPAQAPPRPRPRPPRPHAPPPPDPNAQRLPGL